MLQEPARSANEWHTVGVLGVMIYSGWFSRSSYLTDSRQFQSTV